MNTFTGIGNLGADPELRQTPSGRAVTNFNLAIDRRYYTGQGEDRRLIRETDWVRFDLDSTRIGMVSSTIRLRLLPSTSISWTESSLLRKLAFL